MAPLKPTGFWSYTSADDAASDGRLSRLRAQLANRLRQQLGRPVHLFQDLAAIPPGTLWEQQIKSALAEASFFIPILSPGFLQSEWCTREVLEFRSRMESRGRDDLILPVHYLDVSGFATVRRGDCFDPKVHDYLRSLQWVDFRTLEPLDSNTTEVRVWLGEFARRIEEALYREVPSQAGPKPVPPLTEPPPVAKTSGPAGQSVSETGRPPVPVRPEGVALVAESPSLRAPAEVSDSSDCQSVPDTAPQPYSARPETVPIWKKPAIWAAAGVAVLAIGYFGIAGRIPTELNPATTAPAQLVPALVVAAPFQPPTLAEVNGRGAKPAPAPDGAPPSTSAAVTERPAPKELRDTCPASAICPDMVLVPHGSFQMGTTDEELAREKVPEPFRAREKDRHPVTINYDFYIGKYDVTVGEFKAFVRAKGARPPGGCVSFVQGSDENTTWQLQADRSWEDPGFAQTDRDPVVCVSHDDALAYVDWLNTITITQPYRLPSEAEWEYSARGVMETARFWGDSRDPACHFANVADEALANQWNVVPPDRDKYFDCNDGFAFTAPVGSFLQNPFGLYDMLGNVWQWTGDCWSEDYKKALPNGYARTDPGCLRVRRGGAWNSAPWIDRSGSRLWGWPNLRNANTGFRVARTL